MRESLLQELDVGDLEIFQRPAKSTFAEAFISNGKCVLDLIVQTGENWFEAPLGDLP